MFVSGLRETNFDQWRDLPRLVGFRDPTTAWWDPIPFTYIFGIPFYDYQPRLGSPSSSAAVGFSDARVEMILPPTSPQAGETAQVQVTMQEPDGTPLAERVIAWQVSGVGSFVSVQGATDAGGRAIAQVTSQKSGTMTATVTTSHGLVKASGSIQWLPGPPSALRMSPASSSGTAGSPVSVKAVLTDAYGNGIPGASIDWAIESGPGSIVSAQPQTDASGTATAIVRSTTVGTTRLRAAVLGTSFQATASIFWQPGPPTKLTLEPTASTLRAGTLGALTAQVTDAYGNAAPVPRLLIRWEWSGTGVLAGFEPLTDADGRARAQPLSLTAGTQRVTAILHSTGARAEATVQWT